MSYPRSSIAFFEQDQWPFDRVSALPMVRTRYSGRNGNLDAWFQAREAEKQVMFCSRPALKAPPERRAAVAELFSLANFGMVIGNFEIDMSDGDMRFKVSADVEGIELSSVFLKNMAYTSVVTMDRYVPGIMKVIYGGVEPAAAVKEIEGSQ